MSTILTARKVTAASLFFSTSMVLVTIGCVPSNPDKGPEKHSNRVNTPHTPKHHQNKRRKALKLAQADPPITKPFEDDFDRPRLGSSWRRVGSSWRIKGRKLCGQNARNHGVWLKRKLPRNARIEFDAVSYSPDGDIKAELWGDGVSGATSVSYTNATSYLTIFGGWKNKLHVLARLNEHGRDRQAINLIQDAKDLRQKPVEKGRVYGFRIERSDGKTIAWWVDNVLIHRFVDSQPLAGPGHDHLGFNDWATPVCFDNLRITPL